MEHYDLLIIGGGAAGIAAATAAFRADCASVAIVDRKPALGGVLLQCTHRGFGRNLTGIEYAQQLLKDFPTEVTVIGNTTVLSVEESRVAHLSGGREISFSQLILATGCREIPMGALPIAGTRPKGIYTAGQMQEMMNLHGFVPEGPAVILGSGDLGLIMANQLAQEGIAVTLVEQRERCGGMARNQRCLKEHPIRLICGQTVTEVRGQPHLEGCRLSGGEWIPCKTLLLAVGLRPERTLTFHLGSPEWLHLCGNCNTVHPIVEGALSEAKQAAITAWETMRKYR
ncbi:MAG: FAD/NAD(P)-binding oxidoreductase [Faecousia sp.]